MKCAPIHNIFKCGMFVELQDKEYPYHIWISKVLKNVGERGFLQIQGTKSLEKKPFWLFCSNDSIFPLSWAEEKRLPWRTMNLDASLKKSIDSSGLLNVLECKIPEQHGYKVGEMLEVINHYSLMEFYTATFVKIYDHRYFKAGRHTFLLNSPSDWKKQTKFSWSKYI